MLTVDSDAEALAASRADPSRFAALYDRHAAQLYRYAYQPVGAQTAEDAVADTFLAAFQQRESYDQGPGRCPGLVVRHPDPQARPAPSHRAGRTSRFGHGMIATGFAADRTSNDYIRSLMLMPERSSSSDDRTQAIGCYLIAYPGHLTRGARQRS